MNTSLRLRLALLLVFLPLAPAYPLLADVIYVDANATGANNGSSWTDAYNYLQDALTAAVSSTQIWVAQGTYRPDANTSNPGGTNDRTATFQLKNGVAIYGGYPNGGGSRDPNTYVTILSGDINVPDDNNDNSFHIVTGSGTDSNSILDSFTITAGNANGPSQYSLGAGMYNSSSSPTVTNCTFSSNTVKYNGGGIYDHNSSPALTNCTFIGNSAGGYGGGMCNKYDSDPTVTNCTFSGNLATAFGGGMFNTQSDPTVTNCTFNGNSATSGGGMYDYNSSDSVVTNCTFSNNSATNYGGGIYNEYSNPNIVNCTFSGNSAYHGAGMHNYCGSPTVTNCTFNSNTSTNDGAGMYNSFGSPTIINCIFSGNKVCFSQGTSLGGGMINNYSSPTLTNCKFICNSVDQAGGGMFNWVSNPTITNCTFSGNLATDFGGGMYNQNHSSPTVTNCTFSNNSATNYGGGGMYNYNSSDPVVTNCILWGNTAPTGPQIYNSSGCSATVSFSDVQGGWAGTGNINADPLFIDLNGPDNIPGTEDDNLRLSPGSPCIDTANNVAVPAGLETDLDGRDRFVDGDCNATVIVDMGAFEFTYAYFGDFDSDCDVDFIDFAIQTNFWLTDEFLVDIAPTPAGNGIVDTSDLAILCDNWLEDF